MAEPGEPTRASPGNVFTNKIGPLPMWAWVAIVGGGIVVWAYLKNRNAASTQAASSTPASDVPQFVNQTYTTVTAPTVEQPAPQTGTGSGGGPGTITSHGPIPGGSGDGGPPGPVPYEPGPYHPKRPGRRGGGSGEPIFNAKYTVRPGDTLNSVAKKYHITREQLAHANGYGTGAGLRTGEVLKVPSPAPGGSPNRAP